MKEETKLKNWTNGKWKKEFWKTFAEYIKKRDKGICAICKVDTRIIAKNALKLNLEDRELYLINFDIPMSRKIWKRKFGGGLWDADHILPVNKGGGCCGLDNLRTLCIPCHKNITFKQN